MISATCRTPTAAYLLYSTYPGMYVPVPLAFRLIECESSPDHLAEELLALTKMNWNQTQLSTRKPITLETAKRVGDILRRLLPDVQPQARYALYMWAARISSRSVTADSCASSRRWATADHQRSSRASQRRWRISIVMWL